MSLVVDASVALRWYVDSPGSPAAVALLEEEGSLIAPDLVVSEVGNAAWRLVRSGEIGAKHGRRIAAAIASAFSVLASGPRLSSRAFELALELEHPVYDCFYLALADLEATQVITADRRLLNKLQSTNLAHLARTLTFSDVR